jgi:predicted DNA-binding protein (UPF0278 family)
MKNNIGIFIAVFLTVLVANAIYEQINKEQISAKAVRLECQKKVTSFEKGFGNEAIKDAQTLLENGNFKINSYIEKSVYMESKLFEYIKLSDIDKIAKIELEKYIKNKNTNDGELKVTYYIYENDKKHPGKKTEKSKNYAGYVVFKFKNTQNKLVFQSQIDFMNMQGKDIPQSIQCAIESFTTYNK